MDFHLPQGSHPALRSTLTWSTLLLLCSGIVAGCAPDTVKSMQATGFDGYLQQVGTCRPLQIGDQDIGEMMRQGGMGTDNYNYFLDQTSRLYYNRISAGQYRESLTGFFGSGSSNDASFSCILAKLPAQRPNAPM
jgi:hypothetical protein